MAKATSVFGLQLLEYFNLKFKEVHPSAENDNSIEENLLIALIFESTLLSMLIRGIAGKARNEI